MKYRIEIPPNEVELLVRCLGHPLHRLAADAIAVECHIGPNMIRFEPEEAHTPDTEHRHAEVVRPSVRVVQELGLVFGIREIARDLGTIESADRLSTLVSFSPVHEDGPTMLGGTLLPGGRKYGHVFNHPSRIDRATKLQDVATVELDVGIRFGTSDGHRVFVYTDSVMYQVGAALDSLPKVDWVGQEVSAALTAAVRNGGS